MLKVVVDDLTKTRPKLITDLIRFALLQYKKNIADSLMKFKISFFVFFFSIVWTWDIKNQFFKLNKSRPNKRSFQRIILFNYYVLTTIFMF